MNMTRKITTSLAKRRAVDKKAFSGLLIFALIFLFCPSKASAINISDSPMESLVQAAPPNIMFVLDDSGSMDWEFMTTDTDGKFDGNTEYLYNSGDNTYSTYDSNGTILSGDNRKKWKSQWYGHNRLYYNPQVNYEPWPGQGLGNVSTTAPPANPINATPTFNLDDTFTSITATEDDTIYVDNITNFGNPYAANGNFFTFGGWESSSHTPRWGGSSLASDVTSGINAAFWTPRLTESGDYGVWIFYACNAGADRDPNAQYTVFYSGGEQTFTLNQMDGQGGDWVYLGNYNFDAQDAIWPTPVEVIVDNKDTGSFTTTGTWSESSPTPEWAGSSYYTNNIGKATWTPDIPEDGSYNVYTWYNCYTGRDENALFTIEYDGGTDEIYVNEKDEAGNACGGWVYLGTYDFLAGTGSTVSVERHEGSTDGSTVADAVRLIKNEVTDYPQHVRLIRGSTDSDYPTSADAVMFVPPSGMYEDVNVKNSHYYMLDDTDNDGERDSDEDVYLVNFDGGVRTVYKINIEGEIIGSQASMVSELPNSIRPAVYTESGDFVRWVTAEEDLQNFANWFSYYRRRELTAKAAISRIINGLEGVSVGYYTINSSSHRQPVLPIKLDTAANIIVDNLDSGYTESGSWSNSSSDYKYKDSTRYTSTIGSKATWTPNISSAGDHKVYAWWNCYSNRDTNAKYTVDVDGDGTPEGTHYVNQRDESGNTCGEWVELDTYTFPAGTSGSVSVERTSSSDGSSTCADAVMFENVSGATTNVDETDTLLSGLYSINSNNSTPLRTAFQNVGRYFDADDGNDGNLGASPYDTEADGGACQHAFCILMTDGYYNGSSPSVGNVDDGMDAPYGDGYPDTLADVAMKYYDADLSDGASSSLSNLVPTNSCDKKETQHLVTYSVSFGVTGTLTPQDINGDGEEDDPCFLNDTTPKPTWPDPTSGNAQKIDDLWHAAVNGHGQFFSAGNPEELVDSLESLFENIASRSASGASVSVNGEELGSDTTLYQAIYSSDTWTGDIYAYPMDPASGEILRDESDIKWQASGKSGDPNGLQSLNWDTGRKIVTYKNATDKGIAFRYDQLSDVQKTALDATWSTDSTNAENLVDYIRGKEITGFRARVRKLGDIVHSAPLLKGDTIYAGANDGMLHAFDKDTGRERFAYIPNLVFNNLSLLADTTYTHRFYVDNSASTQAQGKLYGTTTDLVVCGLGKGGKGYFALDVTAADTIEAATAETAVATSMPFWEFPNDVTDAGDISDMGFSFSTAHIVKTNVEKDGKPRWVVIFGNGYNSTNGVAKLFILDAEDGTVIRKIDTKVGSGNGLSTPAVVDVNNDFKVDYVYAGDLKGNMWKFDLTDESNTDNWEVAYGSDETPKPLFQATGQPITARPDVMWHPTEHGYMVVFATGQYFHNDDRSDLSQQSVYGIWDYGDDADNSEYLGSVNHITGVLTYPTDIMLQKQEVIDTRTVYGDFYRTLSDNEVQWRLKDGYGIEIDLPADGDGGGQEPNPVKHAGWFFDFPNTGDYEGERVVKDINIRDGMAFVLSFIPNNSPCSGGGNSFFYIINPGTGGRFDSETMDINDDGHVDEEDLVEIEVDGEVIKVSPTGKLNVGMLHAPKFIKINEDVDKVIMSDSSGDIPTVDIEGESLGMYYWIERDE